MLTRATIALILMPSLALAAPDTQEQRVYEDLAAIQLHSTGLAQELSAANAQLNQCAAMVPDLKVQLATTVAERDKLKNAQSGPEATKAAEAAQQAASQAQRDLLVLQDKEAREAQELSGARNELRELRAQHEADLKAAVSKPSPIIGTPGNLH